MAGLTIKGYASLIFFTLFTGCSLSSITAQAELETQTSSIQTAAPRAYQLLTSSKFV